jgi:hypothetical protein
VFAGLEVLKDDLADKVPPRGVAHRFFKANSDGALFYAILLGFRHVNFCTIARRGLGPQN